MSTSDNFTPVNTKKKRKKSRTFPRSKSPPTDTVDYDSAKRNILCAEVDMQSSPYYQKLCTVFRNSVFKDSSDPVKSIVCYGLGHISTCPTARFQLALLMCLRALIHPEVSEVYDPVFTEVEHRLLESFGFKVIALNEEGKRCARDRTLFYMPHCGKPLYNSVLWANWRKESLRNVIIFGNSFSNIWTTHLERHLNERLSYLVRVKPAVKEFDIENVFRFTDIFNDQALHTFDGEVISSEVFSECDEPSYCDDDEIIVAE
ncbi:SRR1-like protein [Ornithodoros turicata]|uniref:SRR1-like protein n=1 Tax=Ornithodoros turicata TaxID=34597 RepID=UPI0031396957